MTRLATGLILLCLCLPGASALAAPVSSAAAQELAAQVMPPVALLGTGWVRPWETPEPSPWVAQQLGGAATEEAFWAAMARQLNAFPLLPTTPAQALPEMLRNLAAEVRSATEAAANRDAPLRDVPAKRAEGPPAVPPTSPVLRQTMMTYLRAENWRGGEDTAPPVGLDMLTIRVMFLEPTRVSDVPDLSAADADALRADLQRLVGELANAAREQSEALNADPPASARELAAYQASVKMLDYGACSYLIRCGTATTARDNRLPGLVLAWLRRGNALAEVSVTGPAAASAATRLVETVLGQLDKTLASAAGGQVAGPGATDGGTAGGTLAPFALPAAKLRFEVRNGIPVVTVVERDGVGANGGVLVGDRLIEINNKPTAAMTPAQIRQLLFPAGGRKWVFLTFADDEDNKVMIPLEVGGQ